MGVAGRAENNVWAVGFSWEGKTLIEHFNGAAWQRIGSPNVTAAGNRLNAVAYIPGGFGLWAVGSDAEGPLIERYA